MDSSLGYVLALALVLAVAGLVGVVRAVRRRQRRQQARRRQERAEALAHAGFGPIGEAALPGEMPDWEIAPRKKRGKEALHFERDGLGLWIFDHTQSRGYLGWNEETSSGGEGGDVRTYRHTLACFRVAGLDLPAVDLIPNQRRAMGSTLEEATGGLREQGHAGSAAALGALQGLLEGFGALAERPGALTLDDQPELEAAFKTYGDDEDAVRRLVSGAFGAKLLEQKGTILSGRGEWLLISFNVGLAATGETELDHGLLAPEQAARLAHWGLALVETLSGRRYGQAAVGRREGRDHQHP